MLIWTFGGLFAASIACLVWGVVLNWRFHRTLRHARVLDLLLAKLCAEAFMRQHEPIWNAWSAVMGSIDVNISQSPRMGDDT